MVSLGTGRGPKMKYEDPHNLSNLMPNFLTKKIISYNPFDCSNVSFVYLCNNIVMVHHGASDILVHQPRSMHLCLHKNALIMPIGINSQFAYFCCYNRPKRSYNIPDTLPSSVWRCKNIGAPCLWAKNNQKMTVVLAWLDSWLAILVSVLGCQSPLQMW